MIYFPAFLIFPRGGAGGIPGPKKLGPPPIFKPKFKLYMNIKVTVCGNFGRFDFELSGHYRYDRKMTRFL